MLSKETGRDSQHVGGSGIANNVCERVYIPVIYVGRSSLILRIVLTIRAQVLNKVRAIIISPSVPQTKPTQIDAISIEELDLL